MKKNKVNDNHIATARREYKIREKKRQQPELPQDVFKSEFVSVLSHELRTPLTIIKQGLCLLRDQTLGPTTPEQDHALQLSLNSAERLIRMVSEILDFSRMEKGKLKLNKTIINLLDLTEEVFEDFDNMAKKENKLFSYQVVTERPELMLYADVDRLTQVLFNIIQNALKHTKAGDAIEIIVNDKEAVVDILIRDGGEGIPPDHLSKIFDKFHQVEGKSRSGLGLGLAIAAEMVQMHGGKIVVTSKLGVGTEFNIRLNLAVPLLPQVIKLIQKQDLSKKEMAELRKYGLMKLLLEMVEYPVLDIDEKEALLQALEEKKLYKGRLPSSWDHIEDFLKVGVTDKKGRSLSAANYREAFLMAYIEKNMGEFEYKGKPVHEYGNTESKRSALMALVKSLTPDYLARKLEEIEGR